jgi:hypothetical protein
VYLAVPVEDLNLGAGGVLVEQPLAGSNGLGVGGQFMGLERRCRAVRPTAEEGIQRQRLGSVADALVTRALGDRGCGGGSPRAIDLEELRAGDADFDTFTVRIAF